MRACVCQQQLNRNDEMYSRKQQKTNSILCGEGKKLFGWQSDREEEENGSGMYRNELKSLRSTEGTLTVTEEAEGLRTYVCEKPSLVFASVVSRCQGCSAAGVTKKLSWSGRTRWWDFRRRSIGGP